MSIPPALATRFLQLVMERRFAEAERMFKRLRKRVEKEKNEWNTGYLRALNGILLAQKSNDDQYMFLSNLDFGDGNELQEHRREFLKHAKKRLHAEYDRGFFSAWAEYVRVLLKMKTWKQEKTQTSGSA